MRTAGPVRGWLVFPVWLALAVMGGRASAAPPTSGRIAGTVVDARTQAPIFEAVVVVSGPGLPKPVTVQTDMLSGSYSVEVPPGTYGVLVVFGKVRAEHPSVVVAIRVTTTIVDQLDVSGTAEVTTIHDRALAPPAVAAVPSRRSENRVLPYTDEAISSNDWSVAWLLLDVGADGKVQSFRFLSRPGHGLEAVARREAFNLAFVPARDATGRPIASRGLWKLEWPPFWRKDEIIEGTYWTGGLRGDPPCRGEGPLRMDSRQPVYRDCSRPDYSLAATAEIVRPPVPGRN